MRPIEEEVDQILCSSSAELDHLHQKLRQSEERLTDQDLGDVVNVLNRRVRALTVRIDDLKKKSDYATRKELAESIFEKIKVFQDQNLKAKLELAAGQVGAFFGVLGELEDVLRPKKLGRRVEPSGKKGRDMGQAA